MLERQWCRCKIVFHGMRDFNLFDLACSWTAIFLTMIDGYCLYCLLNVTRVCCSSHSLIDCALLDMTVTYAYERRIGQHHHPRSSKLAGPYLHVADVRHLAYGLPLREQFLPRSRLGGICAPGSHSSLYSTSSYIRPKLSISSSPTIFTCDPIVYISWVSHSTVQYGVQPALYPSINVAVSWPASLRIPNDSAAYCPPSRLSFQTTVLGALVQSDAVVSAAFLENETPLLQPSSPHSG